jgi:hypothetical protein
MRHIIAKNIKRLMLVTVLGIVLSCLSFSTALAAVTPPPGCTSPSVSKSSSDNIGKAKITSEGTCGYSVQVYINCTDKAAGLIEGPLYGAAVDKSGQTSSAGLIEGPLYGAAVDKSGQTSSANCDPGYTLNSVSDRINK